MAERYLIVQLADIGDLIVSTPALAALRESKPEAHIALLTTVHAAPILSGTNLVNEIITFDKGQFNSSTAFFRPANLRQILGLRRGHYDAVIFFHHFTLKLGTVKFALIGLATGAKQRIGLDNGNGWFLTDRIPDGGFGAKHQAQYWLDLVGLLRAKTVPRPPVIGIAASKDESQIPHKKPRVVIHAGSGGYSMARRWDAQKFAQVADRLVETYQAEIILVGTKDDDGLAVKTAMKHEPVDMIGKTKLDTLARLITDADLFIGADSGVMHIASATGTPIVTVFGPSNPDAWSPWTPGRNSIVVRSVPECSPCSYVGHSIGLREGCAARTCMRMVMPEDVFAAAKQILDNDGTEQAPKSSPAKPIFNNRIHILGLPVDGVTYAEWLDLIDEWVNTPRHDANAEGTGVKVHHVCTINPEFMMIAQRDINFYNILNRADLCVPDGVGLLWAAKRRNTPLPQRVTGSDGVPIIAERAAQKGWHLFFLGAAPGIAEQAANILRAKNPRLQIVGTYSGSPAPDEEDALVQMVNNSNADILFVAYGAPEQDKWIARNLPRLQVKMAMGVGGSFDFIAGTVPRAPLWMQKMGLEWLFRLYLQPWRIWRMLRLPRFVLAVLLEHPSRRQHNQ
jgi:N-acetylglucosaminyldiphosphoundecaprenol N-acetyl-beta-D-mannosaminyltransferase